MIVMLMTTPKAGHYALWIQAVAPIWISSVHLLSAWVVAKLVAMELGAVVSFPAWSLPAW